uniref:C-type lectin domain-containing protein n=1 Tax=Acanthochromis polyacanthus TaxID=80966 RepID=A0A3Q1G3T5_9TELE
MKNISCHVQRFNNVKVFVVFFDDLRAADEKPRGDCIQCGCPTSWYNFNGRCYKYILTPQKWFGAQVHCASMGANLVSIHSSHEQTFVTALISSFDPSERPTWIGFNDLFQEGRWTWSDGSEVNFVFWSTGEPNGGTGQNCVLNWGTNWKWIDYPCSYSFPFVCTLS